MIVLGRARTWRSVKREHVTFHNCHTFEVARDRGGCGQTTDSSAYHNRMLTYGRECHYDSLASFPVPSSTKQRRLRERSALGTQVGQLGRRSAARTQNEGPELQQHFYFGKARYGC